MHLTTPHVDTMAQQNQLRKLAVVTGAGGIGTAIARRVAPGRKLVLADVSEGALGKAAKLLGDEGYEVETYRLDVSDYVSVAKFAELVAQQGQLEVVAHTAGLSPVQAVPTKVMAVDLLGTANIIEAFYQVATPALSVVCIASLAGQILGPLPTELEHHLATAPLQKLLERDEVAKATEENAYGIAKRGNVLRAQAVSRSWGLKGARINTVSPGVIMTPMLEEELKSPAKLAIDDIVGKSAVRRKGSPEDIANAVEFLVSPSSSFITGTDLLVDGGALAGTLYGDDSATK